MGPKFQDTENYGRMQRGELYDAFATEFLAARRKCATVWRAFNNSADLTRREMVSFWNQMTFNNEPLPPPAATPELDDELLQNYPWIERPIRLDYGFNIRTGSRVFIDSGCVILDTGKISIGSRTKIGPNVSLFGATHLIDPTARDGINAAERGGNITIGDDCWIGGNVTILHDVTIGEGCTIGAGSVVTRNIPPYSLAVGAPAKVIRQIERLETKETSEKGVVDLGMEQLRSTRL